MQDPDQQTHSSRGQEQASAPRYVSSVEGIAPDERSGRKDAASTVREALARIKSCDEEVRAWVYVDSDANCRAGTADSRDGPLSGVPFGVKDLFDVRSMPTSLGLLPEEYRAVVSQSSAAVVARLEAGGAVAVGKTVTSALALDRPGPTRNPLDVRRSPGASSSGSAAAVAAGMVPLALGSQAIGSVIRPASYCGVWGFVPSFGAVPEAGAFVLSPTLDRPGLFAPTAEGLRQAGLQMLDRQNEPTAERGGPIDCRVAVMWNESLAVRAPEPYQHLQRVLRGHATSLVEVRTRMDFQAVLNATRTIAAFELHQSLRTCPGILSGQLNKNAIDHLLPEEPGEGAYRASMAFRDGLMSDWVNIAGEFDAILLPSATAEAPMGLLDAQDPAPAALGSLLGLPTINLPVFRSSSGFPLGCQLLTSRDADVTALDTAIDLAAQSIW